MENKQMVTLAYELALEKYKANAFTFEQLWKDLIKKAKLDKAEQETVGYVYTSVLQDNRFIFIGNNQWKLREFLTEQQQQDLSNALYDFKKEQDEEEKRLADLKNNELNEMDSASVNDEQSNNDDEGDSNPNQQENELNDDEKNEDSDE